MRLAALAVSTLGAALVALLVWPLILESRSIEVRPAAHEAPAAQTKAVVPSTHVSTPPVVPNLFFSSPDSPLNFSPPAHSTGKISAFDSPAPTINSKPWPSSESVSAISRVFSPDPLTPQTTETLEVRVPDLPGRGPATIPAVLVELADPNTLERSMAPDIAAGVTAMAEEFVSQLEAVPAQADEQTYREAWDRAQAQSDALFKARYGEKAWMQLHTQANHPSLSRAP